MAASPATGTEARETRVPMIAIALGQAIRPFNVSSLPVSIAGMVESFDVPPTTVGTAIVMYSLGIAGLVMPGAERVQRFGSTRVFRAVALVFAIAQALMVVSPAATFVLAAQGRAGLGFAGAVIEGMGAGHVHADAAPRLGEPARRMPVLLAARPAAGLVLTGTYGYPGGEIDLIAWGLIPAGHLSGTKARLLLGLALRDGGPEAAAEAFAPYQ